MDNRGWFNYKSITYLIMCPQRGKFTALMSAAHGGHLGILNKLIQNGANVHMKNEVCHYSIIIPLHYFVALCWTLDIRWKTMPLTCTSQE